MFDHKVDYDLDAAEFTVFTKTTASRNAMGIIAEESKAIEHSSAARIESEFPRRKIKARVRETGTDSMKNYMKIMCNHELLNKNEEVILAREIQILLNWELEREKLEEKLLRYVPIVFCETALESLPVILHDLTSTISYQSLLVL